MKKDCLGDRMKNYEKCYKFSLTRRTPMIIRVDGKAFHTWTKKMECERPFDSLLQSTMQQTMFEVAKQITGCSFAYTQSDEISFLITDYERLNTESWFDKNLQKICSVASSLTTAIFNDYTTRCDLAFFDARVFILPKEEVVNYFVWRQQDATRNSINMLAQSEFKHKELQKKNTSEVQDMLMLQKNINWNNIETKFKRGSCVYKDESWNQDEEIPIFTQERGYIQRFIDMEII